MEISNLSHLLQSICGRAVGWWAKNSARQRSGASDAVLYDRKTFSHWTEPDPRGWTLQGRFYGVRGKTLGKRFSLSEERLARGVVALGSQVTPSVLLPAISDWMLAGHSLVVTDLSGILQHRVQSVAGTTGHLILMHSLDYPLASCPLNPCEWIDSVDEARAMAAILLSRARRGALLEHPRAMQAAVDLLAACILHYQNLIYASEARHDLPQLIRDLAHSSKSGVANLLAELRAIWTRDANRAYKIALAALNAGLAPWTSAAMRKIGRHNDLDLAGQLTHIPTVVVLRCVSRWADTQGPYLGALVYALAARMARLGADGASARSPASADSLPVDLVLADCNVLGRLDALLRDVRGRVSILATAESIADLDPCYPSRADAERLLAEVGTQIVFGGCDAPTAEFTSRLGSGLIQPGDVTRLDKEHAIILTASEDTDRGSRLVLHGRPVPSLEREDLNRMRAPMKPITVLPWSRIMPPAPPAASRQPVAAPEQAEPPVSTAPEHTTTYDPIERLLEDAPESEEERDMDLWTREL